MKTIRPLDLATARALIDFSGDGHVAGSMPELQLEGAVAIHNILSRDGVAYLADEVGMGKTYVALGAIGLMRFVNPTAELRVAGGREGHLRSMQPFALYPANSLFVEGYLTTKGDPVEDTYAMIRDAGFEIEGNDCWLPGAERDGDAAAAGRSQFRIPDGSDQLLKPEIARA